MHYRRKKVLTGCIGLLFMIPVQAQKFFKNASFGVQGHYGSFLTNTPKAVYVKDSYTYFGELYFQKPYTSLKSCPWGAGIFYGNSGSKQFIGAMSGVFLYTHLPLLNSTSFNSSIRMSGGLGWIEKPYNKNTNHKNVIVGTHLNGYINFLWQNEFKLTKHLFVNAGLSFSHLSNGGSTMPNLGLNVPAASIGIRYQYTNIPNVQTVPDSFNKKVSFILYTSVGEKQQPWIGSGRYLVNIFNAEVTKRFSNINQYGGGIVLFYDRSLSLDPRTIITSVKRNGSLLQVGAYVLYEHFIGNFSIPVELGAYAYNQYTFPLLFEQVGLRYKFSNRFTVQLLLKTHAGKADVIHAGIGYKLK